MNFERLALEWEALVLPAEAEHLPSSQNNRDQGSEGEQGERDGDDDPGHDNLRETA